MCGAEGYPKLQTSIVVISQVFMLVGLLDRQPSKVRSDCKELKMLCAEDEQSRTCWMTAFRLLKVQYALVLKHSTTSVNMLLQSSFSWYS